MNKLSLKKGRVKQKLQTRTEILKVAKQLMKQTKRVTLEDVAKKASISRATIYRYFPNIELLFKEASLDIAHPSPEEVLQSIEKTGLTTRVLNIQKHYNQLAQAHEIEFRRYLSQATIEAISSRKKVRGARRVQTLKLAVEPFKNIFKQTDYNRFINSASVLMGIDALIVCKDVCGLNNEQAEDTLSWALRNLMKGLEIKN